ncbi:MAG: hypothetical protein JWP84_4256, partial [Tardiphaga sp.]|nr:hypothetical protein [Tardiphaga sp.]
MNARADAGRWQPERSRQARVCFRASAASTILSIPGCEQPTTSTIPSRIVASRCLPRRRWRNRSANAPDCWDRLARVRCVIHGSAGGQMQNTMARKFHGAPPGSAKAIPTSEPLKGSRFLLMASLRYADRVRTCPVIGCRLNRTKRCVRRSCWEKVGGVPDRRSPTHSLTRRLVRTTKLTCRLTNLHDFVLCPQTLELSIVEGTGCYHNARNRRCCT